LKSTTRVASFFAAYFGYLGLFAPYISLWLNGRGFSPTEIGILISPMQWARVVGPPAWGWMADHAKGRHGVRRLIQVSAALALVTAVLLTFDLGFWSIFTVLCLMSFFLSGQVPITESMAMQASKGNLRSYGRVRVWGSIGFIAAVMIAGPWFDVVGIKWLPHSLLLMLVVLLAVTFLLPHREVHDLSPEPALLRNILKEKRIRQFLGASFLMLLAHAPLYTLFSLWLQGQGFTRTEIGLLWALGVVAEIVMFQYQHKIFLRFSVGHAWVVSYLVTAIRFLMIAFSGGSLIVIVAAQLLHAVTFGLHHSASMSLIREWFPAQAQARGQALYTMASYGLGGSIGGICAGLLWEWVSPEFGFVAASLAALAGALVAARALKGGHN
jgi:PPP family 3-phenylpropionic acid transporter